MKKIFYGISGLMTGALMVFGMFYIKEKRLQKQVGGQLVKVNYRYSKDFAD